MALTQADSLRNSHYTACFGVGRSVNGCSGPDRDVDLRRVKAKCRGEARLSFGDR